MRLKEKIEKDFKEALKRGDSVKIRALKLLKASLFDFQQRKRYKLSQKENLTEEELREKSELEDEEIIEILFSEIKEREKAISEFKKGKREDLIKKEEEEIKVLKEYLPPQLSPEEVEKVVRETIEKVGKKEMGLVMKELVPKIKGKAEMGLVSQIVQKILKE
jgi:uncharacterized protein YqeY